MVFFIFVAVSALSALLGYGAGILYVMLNKESIKSLDIVDYSRLATIGGGCLMALGVVILVVSENPGHPFFCYLGVFVIAGSLAVEAKSLDVLPDEAFGYVEPLPGQEPPPEKSTEDKLDELLKKNRER